MEKKDLDWGNIGFSYMPTDKRYVANYKDGAWDEGGMTSDPNVVINECAGILQYCQEIFEGLKAYTTEDGSIVTFRPDLNAERMMDSARRLEMPPFPKERFLEAVDQVGGPQVRNTATIGGNICNGATSADSASTMCALNAAVVLKGPEGVREVPVTEFYTGPGRTVRKQNEVCTAFKITRENYEGWEGHYIKYGKRRAMEIATLGCAVRVKLSPDKTVLEDVRLAYGVAAPTPVRCYEAEEALRGKQVSDATIYDLFADKALSQVNPRTSWRASREFRLQLIGELARRALKTSITLAGGKADA